MKRDDGQKDLRELWLAQPKKARVTILSLEELRKRDARLTRRIWVRNVIEFAFGVVVFVTFSAYAATLPAVPSDAALVRALLRVASGAILAGTALVLWRLHKDGAPLRAIAPDAPMAQHLLHHRDSLMRQRDLLRRVGVWYVGPFLPGLVLFFFSMALLFSQHLPFALWGWKFAKVAGQVFGFLGAVVAVNQIGANKLQRAIDALEK